MEEGRTRRDRLESRLERAIRKQRPDVVEELEQQLALPPFPRAAGRAWDVWGRVRNRMAAGLNGPSPIGWPDLDAFMRRSGVELDSHDVRLLEVIDDAYIAAAAEGVSEADRQRALREELLARGERNRR